MLRNKDPEGYLDDDAVTWATNKIIKRLRQESKLTDEEIAANMKNERGPLKNILMGDMLRLCLGLKYDVVKFMQEVYVEAERLVEAGSS